MPSEPVREKVLQYFTSTLGGVKADATYWTTIDSVSRVWQPPETTSGTHVVVYSRADRTQPYDGRGAAAGVLDTWLDVDVLAFMPTEIASDTDATRLCADIERAILADRTCDGNAINLRLTGRDVVAISDSNPYSYVAVHFTVRYRHEFANPSNQL